MKKFEWSCDEKDRANCRNAHGCHCREITELIRSRDYYQREMEGWKRVRQTIEAMAARERS